MVEEDGWELGLVGQGQSQGSGGSGRLERSLDQGGPDDGCGRWGDRRRVQAALDQLRALRHVTVVLHYSLDDFTLLEV